MPDHRDIYILAAAVVIGILLGPNVLGRFDPDRYDLWFRTVDQVQAEVSRYQLEMIHGEQPDEQSFNEFKAAHEAHLAELHADLDRAYRHRARLPILVALIAAVCVIEIIKPHRRLARLRFILLGAAVALLLAQPGLMLHLPLMFLALVAVACAVLAVPLFFRETNDTHSG